MIEKSEREREEMAVRMFDMSSESYRPSWGRRFLLEAVHHALDFRIENLEGGRYEVKMVGGGFIAHNLEDLAEKLVTKKHLDPGFVWQVLNSLQSDDLVWQIPLRLDQVVEV